MMTETQQARLLEEYMITLHENVNASPPQGLDEEMAQFARRMVRSRQVSKLDYMARSQIWDRALSALNDKEELMMIQTRTLQPRAKFPITWGVMIAMFLVVGLGMMMFINLKNRDPNNYLSSYPLETATVVPEVTPTAIIAESEQTAEMATPSSSQVNPIFAVTVVPSNRMGATLGSQCVQIAGDISSSECQYQIGVFLRSTGALADLQIAVAYFQRAYQDEPNNKEYHHSLVSALFATGQCEAGRQLLTPDILERNNLTSDEIQILTQYAIACEEMSELSSGEMFIYPIVISESMMLEAGIVQPAIPADPIETYILSAGYTFLVQDDNQLKEAYCAGYADFESSDCLYRVGVSLLLSEMDENLARGVGYLRDAYALDPDNDIYRYTLASGLLKINDCAGSGQLLMMEGSSKSIHLNILEEYATVCEEMMAIPSDLIVIAPPTIVSPSSVNEGLDFGDLCMNVRPTSAECFFLKGLFVYWVNGREYSDEAVAYFEQASVDDPESLEYRYQLALALAETGQCEASKRLLLADDGVMPVIEHFNEYCGVLEIPDDLTVIDPLQPMLIESTATPSMTATPTLTPTLTLTVTPTMTATPTLTITPSN